MSAPASASARRFLSCDWGTSAFRLRLVEVATRRAGEAQRELDLAEALAFARLHLASSA